jgi:WD40 repeat protein
MDEYPDLVVGANQQLPGSLKQRVLHLLKSGAEKTFLYVSLVLKDLRMTPNVDIPKWLSDLEDHDHGESVYQRYRLMVHRVIEKDNGTGTTTLQDLLKAVLLSAKALSPPELAIAAGLQSEFYDPNPESGGHRSTTELVQQCGHILRLTEDNVYLVHKSAKDYLTMGDGSHDEPFLPSSSSPMEHGVIAERSLRALLGPALLPMPDLSTRNFLERLDASQEDLRRKKKLQYIYCQWTHHVDRAQGTFTAWPLVVRFFEERFLPWVNVMGHLHRIQRCLDMVRELKAAINNEPTPSTTSERVKALLDDASRFLVRYRPIIRAHPGQVYFLAKYFIPRTSLTRMNYEHIPCCLRIAHDSPADWNPCKYTLDVSDHQWGDKDRRSVTAPRYQCSGFNLAKWYFSYTSRDFRLSFSGNGETLLVGSSALGRNALRWTVADGSFAGSFDATEDGLAHSNDGRLVASWSEKGIGVWDVGLRKLVCRLENSPSACVYKAVKFANDGSAILVWFEESSMFRQAKRRLKVWDARDGSFLQEIDIPCDSLVRDIHFMRNGRVLAVCLGQTILLHDVGEHKTRDVLLGDISEPSGAAFSDDGSILVIVTRSVVAFYHVDDPLRELARWSVPHDNHGLDAYFRQEQRWGSPKSNLGIEIAVSKNARMAALSFRDSIAVFRLEACPLSPTYHSTANFKTWVRDGAFFQSKLPVIDALKFSPRGSHLACARNDDSISIWDMQASGAQSPSRAHPRGYLAPAEADESSRRRPAELLFPIYSPDGKICGASSSGQVNLWEVATASVKVQLDGTPSLGIDIVRSIGMVDPVWTALSWAFSPDSRFAVTTISNRLYLVNTHDWADIQTELPGGVAALAFNSQSTHFALATSTEPPLVLLFDTAAGRCIFRHEARCKRVHAMAFSSSGTLIAGGATSKNLVYYVWGKSDYSSPSSLTVPPQCLETSRHNPLFGNIVTQIMKIEFSRDNVTAVSIICCFREGYLGMQFSTYAEMVTLGGSATVNPRAKVLGETLLANEWRIGAIDHPIDNVAVRVQGRDEYAARRWTSDGYPGVEFTVSCRFGSWPEAVTVGGIEITPPGQHNGNTCAYVSAEQEEGFGWVTWRGKRIVCFPHQILWARRDLYNRCLMIAHEPEGVSFCSFAS